jgi:hypothetical protein
VWLQKQPFTKDMRFSPKRCTHQKLEDTELLICEAQEDIHSTRNSLTAKSKCPKVHSEYHKEAVTMVLKKFTLK